MLTRKKNKKEGEREASKPPAKTKIKKTKSRKKKETVVADAGSKPSADNLDIFVETEFSFFLWKGTRDSLSSQIISLSPLR